MLSQPVRNYLADHRQAHLEKLFELLRIPSIANHDDGCCDQAAHWLTDHLRQLGLASEIYPTEGKPNVIASLQVADDAPTLLMYGHYDVQPAEPLDLWDTPAFEPQVRDDRIYARGANDDKGQFFAHLMAVEAWQQTGGCPVNLKLFIEGEEEIGSPRLESFLEAHADKLKADAAVISDSSFFATDLPSITYSLRGLAYVELTLRGPNRDIHSGLYGGMVTNPLNALAAMVARMHDADGRVMIPGFYNDVLPLKDAERKAWRKLPFSEAAECEDLGVSELAGGEKGFSPLERNWARPTLDCNGLIGGYTGPGSKTIIPSEATAKISMRLVPEQDPGKIVDGFRKFIDAHTPTDMTSEIKLNAEARPVLLKTDSPAMKAGKAAMAEAFGREPAFIRCGASVPITELFQRLLGLDAVLMGFGLPEDRLHSPNESFRLEQLYGGSIASAAFIQMLSNPGV